MKMISTEAWVLQAGDGTDERGHLQKEKFEFIFDSDDEVLVEPIFGCWEGNMTHAVMRDPIDIALDRKESRIVLGNAGVVRVIEKGKNVENCEVGDMCMIFCNSIHDSYGYPTKIYAYDAPNTIGILARQTKIHKNGIIPIPASSSFSLQQWAAFSLRFVTAWANWKVAFKCWRSQMEEAEVDAEHVLAWGGGVCFAELLLAKRLGFNVAMITSNETRTNSLTENGITAINRTLFPNLNYDPEKYSSDKQYRSDYKTSEEKFLNIVKTTTNGKGAAIFLDNIGQSVYRATLKGIARQGVITTSGWKWGMELTHLRAIESINRHIHVHTHYANRKEALEAMEYAEKYNWMPKVASERVYNWEEIPELCEDYSSGKISSFFPLFQVNAV
jgi:NADPH:quinone reductase-like Zn-dependent oxidoreductase